MGPNPNSGCDRAIKDTQVFSGSVKKWVRPLEISWIQMEKGEVKGIHLLPARLVVSYCPIVIYIYVCNGKLMFFCQEEIHLAKWWSFQPVTCDLLVYQICNYFEAHTPRGNSPKKNN